METVKTAPKRIVNWRIREDVLEAAAKEAAESGFTTTPALVNHILFNRYFGKGDK